ncbi:MAG: hypothetical protein F2659_04045 [Actinobacteria bacterium]|uniref:Unannotated protein n=1 Tax=freshwater metagenome TaxID=449393 RepID=A0A6J6NYH2_9ZZZZ|nr:hypothetical protein [Actinomycetota bacterium]
MSSTRPSKTVARVRRSGVVVVGVFVGYAVGVLASGGLFALFSSGVSEQSGVLVGVVGTASAVVGGVTAYRWMRRRRM